METRNADPVPLRTLGNCHLGGGGASFGRGKPFALVAYLACAPGTTATRDELVSLLWSSVDPEEGRHALRHTMWSLRRRLGDDFIIGEGPTVRLGRAIDLDRHRFLAAVDEDRLADAVESYAGSFLPSLALPGGGEFERWADLERGRLLSLFCRIADAHARALLRQGRFREAQSLARRAVDADRYGQAARRLLLDVLVASNDPLTAAAEADAIERFFASEEIDLEPSTAAVVATARAPRAQDRAPERPQGFSTDLVGREPEFALLIDRWQDARAGRFSHVHVSGAAGLGKSRLLDDFVARLRSRRSRLAFVRGKSGERHLPFALAADLAESLARMPGAAGIAGEAAGSLVAMNPSLSTVFLHATPDLATNGDAIRRRAFALADLARAVADDAPLAILIDDLHWADGESKQVVSALLSRLHGVRGMAVTTARPSEDVILQRDPDDSVRLQPLPVSAIADLLASIGTMPDEEWATTLPSQLRQATGGLPLHVIETLKLALDRGALVLSAGAWQSTDRVALRELLAEGSGLERRLRAVPHPEMELLALLALAGVAFTTPGVANAFGTDVGTVDEQLSALEQRGMVRRAGGAWRVAHDEIADAAIGITSGSSLRAAHRRLGTHFAGLVGQQRGLAVQHLLAAGERSSVTDLFRHELSEARRRGDWRPTPTVAREFLGGSASDELVAELAAAIPLGKRRRWRVGVFAGAALMALAFVIGAIRAVVRAPEPDAWVEVLERGHGAVRVARAGLSDATFRSRTRLALAAPSALTGLDSAGDAMLSFGHALLLPDGRAVYHRTTRDVGGIDVFVRTPAGAEERVTDAAGDDIALALSPDGRYVLLSTQRWSPREHADIAIYDFATRTTRALMHTEASETGAQWSPGGDLIVFARRFFDGRPPEVCVIGFDASDERCGTAPGGRESEPVGWRTPSEAIIQVNADTGTAILALDPDTWSYQPIHAGAFQYAVSQNGSYFAARSIADSAGTRWVVGSTRVRGLVRDLPPVTFDANVRFAPPPSGVPYLATVSILGGGKRVDLTRSVQLHVEGRDQFGHPFPIGHVVWQSLDPETATISEGGTLYPTRPGTARIVANLHGWRADTSRVAIAAVPGEAMPRAFDPSAVVSSTDWRTIDRTRWTPFGVPRPFVQQTDRGPAVSTNGDSTFSSGVYSVATYAARGGVGVRTIASVDLNWIQWQIADLEIANADRRTLSQWDHVTGALPIAVSGQRCRVGIPDGEGSDAMRRGSVGGGGAQRPFRLTDAQRGGAWVRLDIQVFPDGRCGLAVDGRPIWITPQVFAPGDSLTVALTGKAYHSHSWFGKTEIWTGVRGDINWEPLRHTPR